MRVASEHVSLRLSLPEPSEVGPPALEDARTPESLRLRPLETTALGHSPWRAASAAPAQATEALFFALRRRVDEARRAGLPEPMRAQLENQLGAVSAMTARLEALSGLEARVQRERGRWLRA